MIMDGSETPKFVTKISVNEQLQDIQTHTKTRFRVLSTACQEWGQTDTLKYPSLSLWLFLLSGCSLRALNRIFGSCKTMLQIHVNMFFSVSDESICDLTLSCFPHRDLFDPIWRTIEFHTPNF